MSPHQIKKTKKKTFSLDWKRILVFFSSTFYLSVQPLTNMSMFLIGPIEKRLEKHCNVEKKESCLPKMAQLFML